MSDGKDQVMDVQLDSPDGDAGHHATVGVPIQIDPFGLVPSHISRIGGLGGDRPGPIDFYAFHTPYIPLDEGRVVFVLQFTDLVATRGTLDVVVNAMSPRVGAIARSIEVQRIPLRLLSAEDGGRMMVMFEALAGMTYCLYGQIFDDSDAAAHGLTVELWRQSDLYADREQRLAGVRTEFGAADLKPVPRIVSTYPPSLANPVSQICTKPQLKEAVHKEWLTTLGLPARADPGIWAQTYIIQALRRYGVLVPRARGLGFGVGTGPLPAAMAASGCIVRALDAAGTGLEALRRPQLLPDETFDSNVAYREVMPGVVPDDLAEMDFLWSLGQEQAIGSPDETIGFIDEAMRCLKPGGVAVHVIGYDPAAGSGARVDGWTPFRRGNMERLALTLISRGHEIAQFKYDPDGAVPVGGADYPYTFFGVIARRGARL